MGAFFDNGFGLLSPHEHYDALSVVGKRERASRENDGTTDFIQRCHAAHVGIACAAGVLA